MEIAAAPSKLSVLLPFGKADSRGKRAPSLVTERMASLSRWQVQVQVQVQRLPDSRRAKRLSMVPMAPCTMVCRILFGSRGNDLREWVSTISPWAHVAKHWANATYTRPAVLISASSLARSGPPSYIYIQCLAPAIKTLFLRVSPSTISTITPRYRLSR